MEPHVAVVIVSHNTRDDLIRCVASLRGATLPLQTVVVDNASGDDSAGVVAERFPEVTILRNPQNVGFGAASNQGVAATSAPCVLFLNSDAELRPGALEAMYALLQDRPDLGIVGPRTVEADGTVQVSFGPELTPLGEWRQRRLVRGVKRRRAPALRRSAALAAREHEPAWVSASCALARRAALEAVGGFDEGFFLYEEDVDLCRRMRQAGWKVLFTPSAEVLHHLGRSVASAPERARLEYQRSHLHFYAKHHGRLATAALRLYLMAAAGAGWMGALGPGRGRAARRRLQRNLLGQARLFRCPPRTARATMDRLT